jgi:type IV pilus assembly protein PilA
VIIIGILAAIALPSMLNQSNKAKEAGAKTTLGAINRAQQAYQLESNTFAGGVTSTALANLKIGTQTLPQGYAALTFGAAATDKASSVAGATGAGLTTYHGLVFTTGVGTNSVTTACVLTATATQCPTP